MPVWKKCTMDVLYYDGEADIDCPCEVKIEKKEIVVSYIDDDIPTLYRGKEKTNGHYELESPKANGKASLHRFENGKILEGFWVEDNDRGMWRIKLS